jgi:hypothetical protein
VPEKAQENSRALSAVVSMSVVAVPVLCETAHNQNVITRKHEKIGKRNKTSTTTQDPIEHHTLE